MKLIIEENFEDVRVLTESKTTGEKRLFIEGIFLQFDIENRNGRIYESKVGDPVVQKYIKETVAKNRAVGELGHPENPKLNEERISHKIVQLKKEGNNWKGKAQLSSSPMGQIAKNLYEDGIQLGVSSRCLGNIQNRNGKNYVAEGLRMITAADIVLDPSAPDAFVNGIMEGKEWYVEGDVYSEQQFERARKRINESVDRGQLALQQQIEFARVFRY